MPAEALDTHDSCYATSFSSNAGTRPVLDHISASMRRRNWSGAIGRCKRRGCSKVANVAHFAEDARSDHRPDATDLGGRRVCLINESRDLTVKRLDLSIELLEAARLVDG
jgi:hypothetical protein